MKKLIFAALFAIYALTCCSLNAQPIQDNHQEKNNQVNIVIIKRS